MIVDSCLATPRSWRRYRCARASEAPRFRIVPGGHNAERRKGLERLFHADPVDGVIHVVSYGFAAGPRNALPDGASPATLAEYRARRLSEELDDFRDTCVELSALIDNSARPVWLLIVVAKVDLYASQVDEALSYYCTSDTSPFTAQLRTLVRCVGTNNVSVDAMPCCARPETFEVGETSVSSTVGTEQRDDYLNELTVRIRQFCGQVS